MFGRFRGHVLHQASTFRSSALSEISWIWYLPRSEELTQNIDDAFVHDFEQLQQIHGHQSEGRQGNLIMGIIVAQHLELGQIRIFLACH